MKSYRSLIFHLKQIFPCPVFPFHFCNFEILRFPRYKQSQSPLSRSRKYRCSSLLPRLLILDAQMCTECVHAREKTDVPLKIFYPHMYFAGRQKTHVKPEPLFFAGVEKWKRTEKHARRKRMEKRYQIINGKVFALRLYRN